MSAGSSSRRERRTAVEAHAASGWSERQRWVAATPSGAIGVLCVITGGLVAAITAPVASERSSWTAAYLVLVAGVAQIGLGLGSAVLAPRAPSRLSRIGTLTLWNLGNASVLAGVLLTLTVLVDVGGIALVIALVLALRTVRHSTGPALLRRAYWLLTVVLGLSIPIGLVLTRIRRG
jgi:hypothetical protein